MNDVQSVPPCQQRLMHHIAVHANANCDPRQLTTLSTETLIFHKNTRCRFKETRFYNKVDRYSEDVANLSVHTGPFFPALSCLSYRLRCRHLDSRNVLPFLRSCVTLRPLTLLRKPPQSMLGRMT